MLVCVCTERPAVPSLYMSAAERVTAAASSSAHKQGGVNLSVSGKEEKLPKRTDGLPAEQQQQETTAS